MRGADVPCLPEVDRDGIVSDGVGIGQVAIEAGDRLAADRLLTRRVIDAQGLQDVFLRRDIVVLRDVDRDHIAGGHPAAVVVAFALCFLLHLLDELHRTDDLAVVVEMRLREIVGIVVELPQAQLEGHVLQVLHVAEDKCVLFAGRRRGGAQTGDQVFETFYIIKGLGPGISLDDRHFQQAGVGLLEAFLADQTVGFFQQLIAGIVNLIRIVLRYQQGHCQEEGKNDYRVTLHTM